MLNKCQFIGNVGNDPEIKSMQSGDKVCNISLAVSESWKDKSSGERKTKTEWVRVVVFSQPLIKVIESYVKKGSKIYIEGKLATRSWEKDGQKQYSTEIVMQPFGSELVLLDSKEQSSSPEKQPAKSSKDNMPASKDNMEDEIPW